MMTPEDARQIRRGSRIRIRDGGGAPWCLERTYVVINVKSRTHSRRGWRVSFWGKACAPDGTLVHEAIICIGNHQSGIFAIDLLEEGKSDDHEST